MYLAYDECCHFVGVISENARSNNAFDGCVLVRVPEELEFDVFSDGHLGIKVEAFVEDAEEVG